MFAAVCIVLWRGRETSGSEGDLSKQDIAVIGGGAKAAALAAKAYCLRQAGYPINVTIFERAVIGAAWNGSHGYTDGKQRLCTAAERDLGFPYDEAFDADVTLQMQSHFSWSAFQVANPDIELGYAKWVSRGRKPPTHKEFAQYLHYAVSRSEATVVKGEVTKLEVQRGLWTVLRKNGPPHPGFHGVVMTGPGPSAARFPVPSDRRCLNGQSFWRNLGEVRKVLGALDRKIVVIGGGGTAAAIAAWLVRNGADAHSILVLNNQATLFTRTSNFFEDQLFDDETVWSALSDSDKREFSLRLNRGVVWESVTEILADAEHLNLIPGKAVAVRRAPVASEYRFEVIYKNHLGEATLDADLVIDASGFDGLWFVPLLPAFLQTDISALSPLKLTGRINRDLSYKFKKAFPRLHLPMHSQRQGPGFMSLMALGGMADRILKPYFDASAG